MVGLSDNRIRMGPMWFEIQLYDEFFTVNVVKIPISAIKLILKLHLKLEWPLESIALFHLFGVSFVFCLKGTTHRASNVVVWCRNSGSSLHNCTKQKRGRKKKLQKEVFFILPYLNSMDTASLGFYSPALCVSLSFSGSQHFSRAIKNSKRQREIL